MKLYLCTPKSQVKQENSKTTGKSQRETFEFKLPQTCHIFGQTLRSSGKQPQLLVRHFSRLPQILRSIPGVGARKRATFPAGPASLCGRSALRRGNMIARVCGGAVAESGRALWRRPPGTLARFVRHLISNSIGQCMRAAAAAGRTFASRQSLENYAAPDAGPRSRPSSGPALRRRDWSPGAAGLEQCRRPGGRGGEKERAGDAELL